MNAIARKPKPHPGNAASVKREVTFSWNGRIWRMRTQGETVVIHEWMEPVGQRPYWASYIDGYLKAGRILQPFVIGPLITEPTEVGTRRLMVDVPQGLIDAAEQSMPRLITYYADERSAGR